MIKKRCGGKSKRGNRNKKQVWRRRGGESLSLSFLFYSVLSIEITKQGGWGGFLLMDQSVFVEMR